MALRGTGSLWMSNMPKSRSRKNEDFVSLKHSKKTGRLEETDPGQIKRNIGDNFIELRRDPDRGDLVDTRVIDARKRRKGK